MGKKKTRAKNVSKGSQKSVKTINSPRDPGKRFINQIDAFLKGKNVVFTVPNFDKKNTKARNVKVTGKELLGDWRELRYGATNKKED